MRLSPVATAPPVPRRVIRWRRTTRPDGTTASTLRVAADVIRCFARRTTAPGAHDVCPRPRFRRRCVDRSILSASATRLPATNPSTPLRGVRHPASRGSSRAPARSLDTAEETPRRGRHRRRRSAPTPVHQDRPGCLRRRCSVDRRPGDLGTVHVQDRQHRAVASWIQERRELPRTGQRPGLRFAVADHTGHHEVRMIEGSAGRMGKGVAEFAAFVDASGCLHTHMAGHSAGSGESPTHPVDALGVVRDFRIDLRVRSLEIRRRDQRRTAVPGTGHVQPVCAGGDDVPIEERVDHRQAGAGPPVPEQSGLDVLGTQRFPQKRVVLQIDLRDGQVVGRCPPLQVERELVFGIVVIGHQRLPYLTRVPEQSARACAQSRA